MRIPRVIRTAVAGIVILAFYATWLLMEWTGRTPDTIILLGAAAIVLGAGYYLWDDAMDSGVDAVNDLQESSDDEEA
ncbi:hypothetical protein [Halobacterium salinarum]|uniref:hypothetical protein n=1 Tax=Halobacterium salinarum TaxID=2242 RepID=UPI0025557CB6|nr:hypothetical protein [Halobacterium salinarum]MDL0133575.1 hypothetical protein [Halobacterium salinarum]